MDKGSAHLAFCVGGIMRLKMGVCFLRFALREVINVYVFVKNFYFSS